MDRFLDRSVFPGPSLAVSAFSGSFVAQATLSGCIAFTNWQRGEVQRLLPPGLELASNTSPTPDLHPVVFIFGDLADGATMFGGFTFPTGIGYQEFAMAIPFVTHRESPYLHTYIPRMYSSYFPPTWSGNTHYGFAKEMARMRWQGPVFVITTDQDALLLHAAVEPKGPWLHGDSRSPPNFGGMQAAFSLPMLGRKSNGLYVGSYFGWDFSQALVRSADALISIDAPLLPGLTPRRCYGAPSGSFDVRRMVWRLSWPFGAPVSLRGTRDALESVA